MISVEATDAGIRVTIPKDEVAPDRLNSFLDWLRMESSIGKSALTEEDANRMAEEAKRSWWAENKKRFIPLGEQ